MAKPELVTLLQESIRDEDFVRLRNACGAADAGVVAAALTLVLDELPHATGARVLAQVGPEIAADVLQHLRVATAAGVLARLEDQQRAPILALLDTAMLARLVHEMPSDEATDVLQDLEPPDAEQVVAHLDPETRAAVQELGAYEETTAGGLMSKEFATVPAGATAGEALDLLRADCQDVEDLHVVYVTDEGGKLAGACSLRDLVLAAPGEPVAELVAKHQHWVHAQQDQEDVARYMLAHDLPALPVVSETGELIGQIALDDAAEVIEQEASEDLQRVSGIRGDETVFAPLAASVRRRLPWLVVNIPLAMLASGVVYLFSEAVEHVPAVVAFLPIVGGIGGNAAGQVISVLVRGLAMREAGAGDMWRCVARQSALGLVLGLALCLLLGGLEYCFGNGLLLASIAALAVVCNCVTACLIGTLLPFVLRRVGYDPAMGANLVTTSITDATGYVYVLGMTTAALLWGLLR